MTSTPRHGRLAEASTRDRVRLIGGLAVLTMGLPVAGVFALIIAAGAYVLFVAAVVYTILDAVLDGCYVALRPVAARLFS